MSVCHNETIFNRVVKLNLAKKLLGRFRTAYRRHILRDPFELAVARWFRVCGDSTYRLTYPLDVNSNVFDLGGYHGDFAKEINERYGSRVFLFEPVSVFYQSCLDRFASNPMVECFNFGLASASGTMNIAICDDGSSFLRSNESLDSTAAEVRNIAEVIEELGVGTVDLIKINIEGGEFELLEYLIKTGLVRRFRFIQVQFHEFVEGACERRQRIRESLSQTHTEMWNFEFVWESWRLTKP